jgi:hypothetical protein
MTIPLSALSHILSFGIMMIDSTYVKHGATFPSMDGPYQPGPLGEDEALFETIEHVIAAAVQLISLIRPAPHSVVERAYYGVSAAIYIEKCCLVIGQFLQNFLFVQYILQLMHSIP